MEKHLNVREITVEDVDLLADYWFQSSSAYLRAMGADKDLLPSREDFCNSLLEQINHPYNKKKAYAIIWLKNDIPFGHCNTNKIVYEKEAYMHLHIWNNENRQKGIGTHLVTRSLPYFFKNLKLKRLYCEPFALNHAPNNLLKRVGFNYLEEYITKPGNLNYVQPVKRWVLEYTAFLKKRINKENDEK